jgi:hypothetical protein
MAKLARTATRLTAVSAALAAGIALAPAASAHSEKKDEGLADLFSQSVNTGTLRIVGDRAFLVDLSSVTRTVDALGHTLTQPRTIALQAGDEDSIPRLGEYACRPTGSGGKDFTAFKPVEIFQDSDKGRVQGMFYVYRQVNSRGYGDGLHKAMTQFEICGVGGSDPLHGRTRKIGLGITYPNATRTYKIGQAWKTGSTPANYSLSMDLKGEYKNVSIGGGISQTPASKLMGSISTPIESPMDKYARNAVNAWWQDSCYDAWHKCHKWLGSGSKDFHGTVVQGLWEFSDPAQAAAAANGGFRVSTFNDVR